MALVDPFDGVAVPRGLVAEFFAVFARCEYAMKEISTIAQANDAATRVRHNLFHGGNTP